jgi:hypothetical protein
MTPTPAPCRRCGAARTPAEACAYGERCEDCAVAGLPMTRDPRGDALRWAATVHPEAADGESRRGGVVARF